MFVPFYWTNSNSSSHHSLIEVISYFCLSVIVCNKYLPLIHVHPFIPIQRILDSIFLKPLVPVRSTLSDHCHPQLGFDTRDLDPLVCIISCRGPWVILSIKHPYFAVMGVVEGRGGDWETQFDWMHFVWFWLHKSMRWLII